MKRLTAILMLISLCLSTVAACAESETIQVIMNARTTQAFSDAAVKEEDLQAILQSGLAATSAINQQPWYFVAITNPDVMEEISGNSAMGGIPAGMTPPEGVTMPAGMTPPAGMNAPGGEDFGSSAPSMPSASGSAKAALGDSPVAIVIYMNEATMSPNASFDCGLATQNMVIAAASLGYGTKIISSPTMVLNGENHDALCEKLGVDKAYTAVAVLLIGQPEVQPDSTTSASVRNAVEEKVSFVK